MLMTNMIRTYENTSWSKEQDSKRNPIIIDITSVLLVSNKYLA